MENSLHCSGVVYGLRDAFPSVMFVEVPQYNADWAESGLLLIQETICAHLDKMYLDEPFENSMFIFRPYQHVDWENGEESEVNFIHKPSGLTFAWYKRVRRGLVSNINYQPVDWHKIIADCLLSI